MKRRTKRSHRPAPIADASAVSVYSLDMVVELTGLPAPSILHFAQLGLVSPSTGKKGDHRFDDDALRTLRRIHWLSARYGMNLPSVKLTIGLLEERERLEAALRALR